jgi:hypothetical protein
MYIAYDRCVYHMCGTYVAPACYILDGEQDYTHAGDVERDRSSSIVSYPLQARIRTL